MSVFAVFFIRACLSLLPTDRPELYLYSSLSHRAERREEGGGQGVGGVRGEQGKAEAEQRTGEEMSREACEVCRECREQCAVSFRD